MNKVALIYFSGTYHTLFITTIIKNKLMNKGFEVDVFSLDNEIKADFNKYDYIFLGYPIHAFNMPRFYLKKITQSKLANHKYLIYKVSGEPYIYNKSSSYKLYRYMKRKNNVFIGEYHLLMPYNILFRTKEDFIRYELEYDFKYIDYMIDNLDKNQKYKSSIFTRFVSFIFRIQRLGCIINPKLYKVDKEKCVRCRKCIKSCPMHNITYNKDKHRIVFNNQCMMCMRCSFNCPTDAIKIGFLNKYKVNQPYDLFTILKKENTYNINEETQRFYKRFKPYFDNIDKITKQYNWRH